MAASLPRFVDSHAAGCEHVLLALLRDTSSMPAQLLARHGIRFSQIRDELVRAENARPRS